MFRKAARLSSSAVTTPRKPLPERVSLPRRTMSPASTGNVDAVAHSHAYIGTGQRGGIVDAVADHPDPQTGGLQFADHLFLTVRQHIGDHLIDARALGNGLSPCGGCRR